MQTEQLERRLILALLDGLPVWKLTLAREFLESMSATMAHTPPMKMPGDGRNWKRSRGARQTGHTRQRVNPS